MYSDVAERWLEQEPEMEEVQREFLLKALRYYQDFAQEQGTNPAVRLATALAYRRVGDIQQKLGDFSSAEPAYTEAIGLLARLADDFPACSEYRTALGHCHHNLGGLLRQVKRLDEAERAYRRAVVLREQLMEEEAASWQSRYDLAASVTALGRLQQGRRPQEAQEQLGRAVNLLEGLVGRSPRRDQEAGKADAGRAFAASPTSRLEQDAAALNLLAMTQGHIAELHWSTGRLAQARQVLEWAVGHLRQALKLRPRHPVYRKFLAAELASLGRLRDRLGELAEAEEAYRQALPVAEKLAEDFPRIPRYRSDLAVFHQGLGDVLSARGRRGEARQAYAQVIAIGKQLVQDFPSVPGHCRDLAWALATCRDPALLDAGEAVRLARRAVELVPRGEDCWRALGVACYRAGDWQGAVTALRKAMALHSRGDSWEWFVLAMAHWQLGDKQQARTWYDRAIRWMDENRPHNGILRCWRAEAAALLDGTGKATQKGTH
jgi:tetratricopeptide (TPR) repeat protein